MRLLTLTIAALIGICAQSQELFIAKVASPLDEKTNGKFITLYNPTNLEIDFDATEYYLVRETNGSGSFANKKLVGKIAGNSTYVVGGKTAFAEVYKQAPNCVGGCISGNGNDAYFLYKGGNETTGTLIDIYGEKNIDGFESPWDYTNSLAERKSTITCGNKNWTSSEWEITKDKLVSEIAPWSHIFEPKIVASDKLNKSDISEIYPNPTSATLNFSCEEVINSISLYNINGVGVKSIKDIDLQYISLNLSDLPAGLYTLIIAKKSGHITTQKVIIK